MKEMFKKILFTGIPYLIPNFKSVKTHDVGISILLCHEYVYHSIYALSSLMYRLNVNLPIFCINDGSLTNNDISILHKLFTITIANKPEIDNKMRRIITSVPNYYLFRFSQYTPITKYKIDAIILSPFKRTILLDSDVLFFNTPTEIKRWIFSDQPYNLYLNHNETLTHHNKIADYELSVRYLLKLYNYKSMIVSLNSGLLCIADKSFIDFKKMNSITKIFQSINYDRMFSAEEGILCILLGMSKNRKAFPNSKYIEIISYPEYQRFTSTNQICIHYVNYIKPYFMKDAIVQSLSTRFFGGHR